MRVVATFLLAEMRDRGARDVEGAIEVHLDDRVPFLDRHVMEHAVAQDAGIVHDDIDTAEIVDRILHHALGVVPVRDAA